MWGNTVHGISTWDNAQPFDSLWSIWFHGEGKFSVESTDTANLDARDARGLPYLAGVAGGNSRIYLFSFWRANSNGHKMGAHSLFLWRLDAWRAPGCITDTLGGHGWMFSPARGEQNTLIRRSPGSCASDCWYLGHFVLDKAFHSYESSDLLRKVTGARQTHVQASTWQLCASRWNVRVVPIKHFFLPFTDDVWINMTS